MRGQVLDCRVGGESPAVAVVAEAGRVVDVHLQEIFVEGIIASVPASSSVQELPGHDVNVGTQEAGEWLCESRLRV